MWKKNIDLLGFYVGDDCVLQVVFIIFYNKIVSEVLFQFLECIKFIVMWPQAYGWCRLLAFKLRRILMVSQAYLDGHVHGVYSGSCCGYSEEF